MDLTKSKALFLSTPIWSLHHEFEVISVFIKHFSEAGMYQSEFTPKGKNDTSYPSRKFNLFVNWLNKRIGRTLRCLGGTNFRKWPLLPGLMDEEKRLEMKIQIIQKGLHGAEAQATEERALLTRPWCPWVQRRVPWLGPRLLRRWLSQLELASL